MCCKIPHHPPVHRKRRQHYLRVPLGPGREAGESIRKNVRELVEAGHLFVDFDNRAVRREELQAEEVGRGGSPPLTRWVREWRPASRDSEREGVSLSDVCEAASRFAGLEEGADVGEEVLHISGVGFPSLTRWVREWRPASRDKE